MGGSCYSDPVVAYSGDGSFRLFIRTSGNTVAVNAKANNQSGGWGGWTDLGGNCAGFLAAGNNADSRIQIFVRDSNYNVQSLWQTAVNGGWSSWLNMGGATPTVSIATQPASQNVNVGQNATFTVAANNALSYQWQFNGGNISGATASAYTVNNAQSTNGGTYTVVAGNNAGSVTSSGAVLTVGGVPPTITTQPASQTVNLGQNATFSVVASGDAPMSYQWQFNSANLSGATASSCTVSNAQSTNAGSYSVVVTNLAGSATSTNATLTVIVPSPITTPPASQTVCQGSTTSFCVTAATTPSIYQWQFNGNNLSGGTLSCYTIGNVHTNKAGNYTVVVSNYYGVATSAVATLTVFLPPAIGIQPQSQVVTQGGTGAFIVTTTGTPASSYQWQFNGSNLSSGTSSSYSAGNVHTNKAGAYAVILTNTCGSLTSAVAWLTVVMPLTNQTVSPGAGVCFTVTAAGGDPSLSYQWQKNGTNLTDSSRVTGSSTATLCLSNIVASDAGSYTVVVSNGAGSAATVGATLTVVTCQPPRFDSIGLLLDGSVQLGMSGGLGCCWNLECSSNWVDWVVLTNFNSGGPFTYNDSVITCQSQRFYRLHLCP